MKYPPSNDHAPGRVAQSVTCLATDANLTVASSILARSHTLVEIDIEIISRVILLPSAESFMKSSESMGANCEFVTFPLVSWVSCGT